MTDVLIVSQEEAALGLIAAVVREEGYGVETAASTEQCRQVLAAEPAAVVLVDLAENLPARAALATEVLTICPRAAVAMGVQEDAKALVTAFGGRLPPITFVRKPYNLAALVAKIHDLYELRQLDEEQRDPSYIQQTLYFRRAGLTAASAAMQVVAKKAREYAVGDYVVYVHGEAGTDREAVARAVHELSTRRAARFVAFSCEPAVPPELTALLRNPGQRAKALKGGTLFVDSVDRLPMDQQEALVQVIGAKPDEGGARLVTGGTVVPGHLAGPTMVPALSSRLPLFAIEVKPLRERVDDILPLAVELLVQRLPEGPFPEILPKAAQMLRFYQWPGNEAELVRTLESLTPQIRDNQSRLSPEALQTVLAVCLPDPVGARTTIGGSRSRPV